MFADDEELVRSGLRAMVSPASDIEVVGEAADGRTAVEAVRRFHPDVALLDIRMRTPTTVSALRDPLPKPAVAMLTTFDIDEYVSLRPVRRERLPQDIEPIMLVRHPRPRGGGVVPPAWPRAW